MNLGENIYKFRTQKNMSQGDLADTLEVSRQSVSKWENNNAVPELDKLIKMSELFDITLDKLVGKETTAPTPTLQAKIGTKSSVTTQKVIGILLICFGGVLMLMVIPATHPSALLSCLLLGVPFLICGTICLKAERHAGLLCLCALYLLAWIPLGVLSPNYIRIDFARVTQLIHMLWGAALVFYGNRLKNQGSFLQTNRTQICFFSILGSTILITFHILLFPGLLPTPGLMRS